MRITLESWASRNFEHPPHMNTLRSWAASGHISPATTKICKRWMVEETAIFVEQPASIPADVSGRVADILRRAA